MSNYVTCAICGVVDDPANFDLIFQEGSTYPDYWQCKDDCERHDYVASPLDYDKLSPSERALLDAAEGACERQQRGAGYR